MDDADDYQPSSGVAYGIVGVVLFVVGGSLLANTNEDPTVFRTIGLAFLAAGAYVTVAGAVARGIQLGRRRT